MPRPIKYTQQDMEGLIRDKEEKGIPIKANCREKNWPYVSVNKAMKKYGLSIPKKYAEIKARVASQSAVPTPTASAKKVKKAKAAVATTIPAA